MKRHFLRLYSVTVYHFHEQKTADCFQSAEQITSGKK